MFFALLAQYTEDRSDRYVHEVWTLFQKLRKAMTSPPSMNGLKFIRIPNDRLEVVLCIEAAFAVTVEKSSQLGIFVMVRYKKDCSTNIMHFASHKSRRICKAVLAS